MRDKARAEKRSVRYDGTWRDRDPAEAPAGVPPVIRLEAPQDGATTIRDRIQGEVTVANSELDDLIILRADGTPTYNLSVVVDDHDMGITDVIRGDDHLNNAFRQTQIYRALDWPVPEFAHLPLIHGADGAKLSKRHGALGVDAYRDMGYLPEALRNYLLRLGWGHGDDEIISTEAAIRWFDLDAVGRAPARFDFAKLDSLNAHYIRNEADDRLVELVADRLAGLGHRVGAVERARLKKAMAWLKLRSKTTVEMARRAEFYVVSRPRYDEKAAQLLAAHETRLLLAQLHRTLAEAEWTLGPLHDALETFKRNRGIEDLGAVAQPLRAALTGSLVSPGIYEVMDALGREETLARIADAAAGRG
jgi:glutamyl-tRNA synthetase